MYKINQIISRNQKRFKRVSKPQARKLYMGGEKVLILPCKTRLDNNYFEPSIMNIYTCKRNRIEVNFNRDVETYEYYNCNTELGKYAQFFVEVKENEWTNKITS